MKRKLLVFMLVLLMLVASLSGCGSSKSNQKTLNIYTWEDYIPDSLIKTFEKNTGIKVVLTYAASSAEIDTKISSGAGKAYDLFTVYSPTVSDLIQGGYLAKINVDKIPNLDEIDSKYTKIQGIDPTGEYTIPYGVGRVLVLYNEKTCPKKITSLNDLTDPAFKDQIAMISGSDAMEVALSAIGADPNTTQDADMQAAYDWMKKILPNVHTFDDLSASTSMINGEVTAAITWASIGSNAVSEDDDWKVAQISEKLPYSMDSWGIPEGAAHQDEAEQFLNFLYEPQNLAVVCNEIWIESPEQGTKDLTNDTYHSIATLNLPESYQDNFFEVIMGGRANSFDKYWTLLTTQQ